MVQKRLEPPGPSTTRFYQTISTSPQKWDERGSIRDEWSSQGRMGAIRDQWAQSKTKPTRRGNESDPAEDQGWLASFLSLFPCSSAEPVGEDRLERSPASSCNRAATAGRRQPWPAGSHGHDPSGRGGGIRAFSQASLPEGTTPKGTVSGRTAVVPVTQVHRRAAPTLHSNRSGRSRGRRRGR